MRVFLRLAWLAVFMVGASYAAAVALSLARAAWHGRMPAAQDLLVNPLQMELLGLFLPLYLAVLLIDVVTRGWQASSLRQLSAGHSRSSRSDLGYVALNASGLAGVIGVVAFVGAGVWIEHQVSARYGLNVAAGWPLWLAAPALVLWSGFWSYWEHRFEHTALMWPIHKCHHSAEEFTVLTAEREHPVESAINNLLNALVPVSLGFSPDAIFLVGIVQAVASSIHHSNWHQLAGLEKLGLVTPSGHRIHHGVEARFHDRNYGDLLNIWDRLFGTYVPPPRDVAALPIGVKSLPGRHNTANPVTEVVLMMVDWLSPLGRLLKRASWRLVTIGGRS